MRISVTQSGRRVVLVLLGVSVIGGSFQIFVVDIQRAVFEAWNGNIQPSIENGPKVP